MLLGATGANVTTSGGDYSFEQALLAAGSLLEDTGQSALLLGADEGHETLSYLLDSSIAPGSRLADGGGALSVNRDPANARCLVRLPFYGRDTGDDLPDAFFEALGGADCAVSDYAAVFAGIPAGMSDQGNRQLASFLRHTGQRIPVCRYRDFLGEFASASAVAAVLAVAYLEAGFIPGRTLWQQYYPYRARPKNSRPRHRELHYCNGVLQTVNILLISPNTLTIPYPVYPIGLDYVAGSIPAEHEVRIADMLTLNMDELAAIIDDFSPEIIGISCRNIDNTDAGNSSCFLSDYQHLVAWLRERSSAVIVCGGSGFTLMPEKILAALGADYGIVGEGERFPLLIDAILTNGNPAKIEGVISAEGSCGTPLPWQGKPVRRLSQNSHTQYYIQNGGMLNLQTKRGCTFRCIYCSYPHIEGKTHRLIDPRGGCPDRPSASGSRS